MLCEVLKTEMKESLTKEFNLKNDELDILQEFDTGYYFVDIYIKQLNLIIEA